MKRILVPIEGAEPVGIALETAVLLARKFDSYVEGFAVRAALDPRPRHQAYTGMRI
jgi:hypothetical protein